MASASSTTSESPHWENADTTAITLTIALHQKVYVIPWSYSFIGAEGDDRSVVIRFAHQTVTVIGSGLTRLLRDLAKLTVSRINEPHRTARFSDQAGPKISELRITATDTK